MSNSLGSSQIVSKHDCYNNKYIDITFIKGVQLVIKKVMLYESESSGRFDTHNHFMSLWWTISS